jgi:DNA-binding HxlR family transcriptional regulator
VFADRALYRSDACSVARTLEVVGEKWTLLVLREAFYGVRRFDQFHQVLGCARNLLSVRLATLVEHGLLERRSYRQPGQRTRHEYRLTDKGRDLFPAIVALMQWGDRWTADQDGPPVVLRHRDCGAAVGVVLHCDAGHTGLAARDTVPEPGTGARLVADGGGS